MSPAQSSPSSGAAALLASLSGSSASGGAAGSEAGAGAPAKSAGQSPARSSTQSSAKSSVPRGARPQPGASEAKHADRPPRPTRRRANDDSPDELAQTLIQRFESGFARQANWRTRWEDAAKYILPSKGNINTVGTPGQAQTVDIYDSTANEAALVFAAGLMSSLTPAGELWFRLSPKPGASEEMAAWLDDCTHRQASALLSSNFYLGIHEDYMDDAAFSISALFAEEGRAIRNGDGRGGLVNFVNIPVGTFVIEEDAEGLVDTVIRKFEYTARQAEQKWGREALGRQVCEALDSRNANDAARTFAFLHAIYPRRKGEYREGLTTPQQRPIASVYMDMQGQCVIEEGGYYEMPVAVSRLLRGNNEIYGRGPGDQVMPEIKLVNKMELDLLLALEKQVNPSWLMPEDSASRPDNRPGAVTYWDTSRPENKPEQLHLTARVDMGEQKVEQKRRVIQRAFFVDMFQMLTNPRAMNQQKTAFEVSQMLQEKLVLFSPMFARLVQEKLNPLLERVFNILLRNGFFPPPPASATGEALEYEIDYVSKIALAIKAAQNGALAQMMQLVGAMAQFDPSVTMIIDWQKAARGVARNNGLPQEWQRSEEEVAEMMAAQAQAAQAAQIGEMAGAADKMAGAVKKLGPEAQQAVSGAIGEAL